LNYFIGKAACSNIVPVKMAGGACEWLVAAVGKYRYTNLFFSLFPLGKKYLPLGRTGPDGSRQNGNFAPGK
jgi:hypothetical protein